MSKNLGGRPTSAFSKKDIQTAIDNSQSFREAARYLKTSYPTFKKYAILHELFIKGGLNKPGKGVAKPRKGSKRNINYILEGNVNGRKINLTKFRERLIREVVLPERCDNCGFDEKRVTDLKAPLVLTFNDDDRTNYKLENLKLLCWNCAFLLEGNVIGRKKDYFSDSITGEIFEQIKV